MAKNTTKKLTGDLETESPDVIEFASNDEMIEMDIQVELDRQAEIKRRMAEIRRRKQAEKSSNNPQEEK